MRIDLGRELTRLRGADTPFDEAQVRYRARRILRRRRRSLLAVTVVVVLAVAALSWVSKLPTPVAVESASPESGVPDNFPFVSVRAAEANRRCGFPPPHSAGSVPGGSVLTDPATGRTCHVGYHSAPATQPVTVNSSDPIAACQRHSGYDLMGWTLVLDRTLGTVRQLVLLPAQTDWMLACRLIDGEATATLTFTNLDAHRRSRGIGGLEPLLPFRSTGRDDGSVAELKGVATVWDDDRRLSATAVEVVLTEPESGAGLRLPITRGFVALLGELRSPMPLADDSEVYRDIRIDVVDAEGELLFRVGP